MEAQWKLRYSQEGLKKSTEKSRLAKSLLWFKQGTRPVVTSHFASEAWGWGGELLRRGLSTGAVFCVQAAIRLPALPIPGAWWWEGWGRRCWLAEHFAAQPPDRLGLGEHLSPRYSENVTSNRNLGRKPKQFAIWKSGLTPLPGMGGGGADGTWSLFGPERRFTWVNMLLGNYRKG